MLSEHRTMDSAWAQALPLRTWPQGGKEVQLHFVSGTGWTSLAVTQSRIHTRGLNTVRHRYHTSQPHGKQGLCLEVPSDGVLFNL